MKYLIKLGILLLLSLTSCESLSNIPNASYTEPAHQRTSLTNLWPFVDGANWTFNAPGTPYQTTVHWSKWQGQWGCSSNGYDLWLATWTKTDPSIYWWPGTNATLYMLFYIDSDGIIRSPGYWTNQSGRLSVSEFVQLGNQAPYPGMVEDYQPLSLSAPYQGRGTNNWTSTCLSANNVTFSEVDWHLQITKGWISTPIYTGPVAISDVEEQDCPHCNHEVWTFAPNIGVVKIDQLSTANNPTENVLERVA